MYDLIDRSVADLAPFERSVLDAVRRWVHALTLAGVPGAVSADDPFDAAMRALDGGSGEMLVIQRPCFSTVSETEAVLLGLWRLVAADRLADARRAAMGLVTAPAASAMIAGMVRAAARFDD
jgi:hypothetical protein